MAVKKLFSLLVFSVCFFWGEYSYGQDKKIIQIQQAGSFGKDEANFPGANILLKKGGIRVKLFHEGALIESNKSFFYSKKNAFKAEGEVLFTQGDSLRMTSDYMEYDGETGKAKAWGNVFLKQPDMTLETDTLFLDRLKDLAYYETPGTIVDNASILKSNRGKYYMKEKKYRFISNVRINVTSKLVYVNHNVTQVTALEIQDALNQQQFGAHVKYDGANDCVVEEQQHTFGNNTPTISSSSGGFAAFCKTTLGYRLDFLDFC